MRRFPRAAVFFIACCLALSGVAFAAPEGEPDLARYLPFNEPPSGWSFPTIGAGNGYWRLSVGAHAWHDHFDLRNLQFVADVDLGPGVRWHATVRSNAELNGLGDFSPRFDEHYIEGYGFHRSRAGVLSLSARIGRTRYLRFPYPDAISAFDYVPGIGDLMGRGETGYSGVILTADYAHTSGFGAHATWIAWGFGEDRPSEWAERYVFYRTDSGPWHFEARWGDLPVRQEPPGKAERGFSLFAGRTWNDWTLGLLYEEMDNRPASTGIVLWFAPGELARTSGELALKFTRSPFRGIAAQLPLARGTFGRVRRISSQDAPPFPGVLMLPGEKGYLEARNFVLVGEVRAERIRTYWEDGQSRNWYEHRLSSWGETSSPDLYVLMLEDSWERDFESSVSPNTSLGTREAVRKWERERADATRLNQKVTYRFYKPLPQD